MKKLVFEAKLAARNGHADSIGSVRLGSSSTRTVVFDMAYAPFGETYATSGSTDPAFTTQRQDTVAGVYDFPAREYVNFGRWPSPDPSGLAAVHPRDPQTLNRYAYVRNNPLVMIDAQGLDECDEDSNDAEEGGFTGLCGGDEGGGGGGGGSDPGAGSDPSAGGNTGDTDSPCPSGDACDSNSSQNGDPNNNVQSITTCLDTSCSNTTTVTVTENVPDIDNPDATAIFSQVAQLTAGPTNWISAAGAVEAGGIFLVEAAPAVAAGADYAAQNPGAVQQFGQGFSAGVAPGSARVPGTIPGVVGYVSGKLLNWLLGP